MARWLALSLVAACSGTPGEPRDDVAPPVVSSDDDDGEFIAPSEPTPLVVPTYDESGEIVHPDAFVAPTTWQGTRFWFAATPYPLGNASFENPSIFTGASPGEWQPPAGLRNPIVRPVSGAYLSDPDIVYEPERNVVRLYYRQTTRDADQVWLTTSADGTHWLPSVLVLEDRRFDLISPAIAREPDGSWRMWTVGAHDGGCVTRSANLALGVRRSSDGISWGARSPVKLTIPDRVPWHWDVQYVAAKEEYWALVAAYPDARTCAETAVYFARSANGTDWTVSPSPLLAPGALASMRDMVYRSTFRYFPKRDQVVVWFSGSRIQDGGYHYALASARYTLADLLDRVNRSAPPSRSAMASVTAVPATRADSVAREEFIRRFP